MGEEEEGRSPQFKYLSHSNEYERTIMPPPQTQTNTNPIQNNNNQTQTNTNPIQNNNNQTQIQHFNNHAQIQTHYQIQTATTNQNSIQYQPASQNPPQFKHTLPPTQSNSNYPQNTRPPPQSNSNRPQITRSRTIAPHSQKPYDRSRSQNTNTNAYTYTLPVQNAYGALANYNDDDVMSCTSNTSRNTRKRANQYATSNTANAASNDSKKQKIASESKPPPITIKNATRGDVDEFLTEINADKSQFTLKFTNEGVKVHPKSIDAFKMLRNSLQAGNAKFFTHLLREDQMTKVVLHGLYDMEINELKALLNELDINPSDIKKMSIRKQKYHDHCLYLLYFPKQNAKILISNLNETTSINYVRIKWELFNHKRKGPIQCNRCMQYGHGGKFCHLDPICIRCGDSHESKNCPHLRIPNSNELRDKIPNEVIRCGLCGQNHTANYSRCEQRIAFIRRQIVLELQCYSVRRI
jgi:hypothetical protein